METPKETEEKEPIDQAEPVGDPGAPPPTKPTH